MERLASPRDLHTLCVREQIEDPRAVALQPGPGDLTRRDIREDVRDFVCPEAGDLPTEKYARWPAAHSSGHGFAMNSPRHVLRERTVGAAFVWALGMSRLELGDLLGTEKREVPEIANDVAVIDGHPELVEPVG